jgi:hypothetical protein
VCGGVRKAWPTTAANPQITMEIHISDWTHKFQNKTGLYAKANSELYSMNPIRLTVWRIGTWGNKNGMGSRGNNREIIDFGREMGGSRVIQ